jgi:hypothetical protein
MRHLIVLMLAALLLFFVYDAYPAEKKGFQISKNSELQHIKPKKPVRIKLKRTSKGKYSWELTGDSVDEIIEADEKLRKMLNIK